jgi:hypothetical protein
MKGFKQPLRDSSLPYISWAMTPIFDLGDRARLRERFYGATFSVVAFL